MAQAILEVSRLKTSFHSKNGVVTAVDDVSFTLGKKETLGIVGESGCGKSVTSLSIMQLLPKKFGVIDQNSSIKLAGQELLGKTKREMCAIRGKDIAMIFQDSMTSLNPVMTIGRQMSEAFMTHEKIDKEEAFKRSVEMLRKVGIPAPEERIREYPHQLSGGMRQRVLIAMALACQPQVLIADEPTTALDVTIQAQILELMKELKQTMNTSIILITHDMGVVAEMADYIMVMYAGKVVEQSDAKSLFNTPLHPYTQGLLSSIPRLDMDVEELYSIPGAVPALNEMPQGCRFCDRCKYAVDRCRTEAPELYSCGDRKVRCFLYERGEE